MADPPAPPPSPPAPPDPPAPPPSTTDDALGEAGKHALAEERRIRDVAERRVSELQKELEKAQQASMSEQEKAVAKAKEEGKTEALDKLKVGIARSAAINAAVGLFLDPTEAWRYLDDLASVKVSDNGDVDTGALRTQLEEVVKTRPHLAVNHRTHPLPLPGSQATLPKPPENQGDQWIRGLLKR